MSFNDYYRQDSRKDSSVHVMETKHAIRRNRNFCQRQTQAKTVASVEITTARNFVSPLRQQNASCNIV